MKEERWLWQNILFYKKSLNYRIMKQLSKSDQEIVQSILHDFAFMQ